MVIEFQFTNSKIAVFLNLLAEAEDFNIKVRVFFFQRMHLRQSFKGNADCEYPYLKMIKQPL